MSSLSPYDFAIIRIVPRVERGEFINAGVVVFCPERQYLKARVLIDGPRLRALWPDLDISVIEQHLEPFPKVCAGDPEAGPIAQRSFRERFHWVVSPRSTMIQISPVHTGLTEDPASTLNELYEKQVAVKRV